MLNKFERFLVQFSRSTAIEYILYKVETSGDIIIHTASDFFEFAKENLSTDNPDIYNANSVNIMLKLAEQGSGIDYFNLENKGNLGKIEDTAVALTMLKGYVAIVIRKKYQEYLLPDTKFQKKLKSERDIFFTVDIKKNTVDYISRSVKDILGLEADLFTGKKLSVISDKVHPDDQKYVKEHFESVLDFSINSFPVSVEYRIKDADNNYRFVNQTAICFSEEGKSNKIVCSIHDISDIKEAESNIKLKNQQLEEAKEELRAKNEELAELNLKLRKRNEELEELYKRVEQSEEIFRQVAENTNEIFWLRTDKEILYINDQFEKVWGRKREELIENPYKISEWIHPDDIKEVEPWVNLESLVKDTPFVEQYRIVRPDGEVRWLWSRIFPVFNDEGKPYRLVGIASDITEQKDFEDALRIAKEQAQESDKLKSTFLANISHEIRTPMNGIVGFAELISREDLDPETRANYVSIMKKSSEQLICIIDDIIDFAKIESNQIRIAQDVVNINRLLDQLFVFYEKQLITASKDSVTLLVEKGLRDEEAEVLTDENRTRQVLSYFLDNAVKYTSEGFIKFGYARSDTKIEFFIQDSGIGIEKDKLEIIFERFRQGDEGHTRKYGGTGLGLPIAKGLVNLLGGSITVESESGVGSTFRFTVPYITEQKTADGTGAQFDIEEKYNWKDKLVLVAEDDELNYEYMKVLLEPTEVKTIRAKDGSQAVKMCSNLNFDIILMDIRLPVLNGIQATQHIREMGIKTPIIAQTAFAMDDDERRCLEAGCDKYISKPISKEKLFEMMDELLSAGKK
ncbi:MAG: PAS domain-containing protein [Bacteroidales bacterium]|nr:PAS domain-containing protein [Bacteroidales bacterium]